jgi:hypothetical protein
VSSHHHDQKFHSLYKLQLSEIVPVHSLKTYGR